MQQLLAYLPIRSFRLEAVYTVARLRVLPETRHLAGDLREAAETLAKLEVEAADLAVRKMEGQAAVEMADDAWDDTMLAFRHRLLEQSGNSTDSDLYRRYFSEIPSQVTSMSYLAEIMISKELESALDQEVDPELQVFAERLAEKREDLEKQIKQHTALEVEEARFINRVSLAKSIVNRLRRLLFMQLREMAETDERDEAWVERFFYQSNDDIDALDLGATDWDEDDDFEDDED